MSKPDADTIITDANKLQADRFQKRDLLLKERTAERFNQTTVDVPLAYRKTTHQSKSSVLEDEGQQIATLVHADPVPHLPPPRPEGQPATTKVEKFLMAWEAETTSVFGPVRWQETLAQVHDNIGFEYVGWRKVPYKGQPSAPSDENDYGALADFTLKNDRFKKNAGVKGFC